MTLLLIGVVLWVWVSTVFMAVGISAEIQHGVFKERYGDTSPLFIIASAPVTLLASMLLLLVGKLMAWLASAFSASDANEGSE